MAREPFSPISPIASVIAFIPPSPPLFIPSSTRMNASLTSLFSKSEKSFRDIPAIFANVSVFSNIFVMVCPTAVEDVSAC